MSRIDPLIPKRDKNQNSTKQMGPYKELPKKIHINSHTIGLCRQTQKLEQMGPCKSTVEEVLYEWSHHRITSTDSKVLEVHDMSLLSL